MSNLYVRGTDRLAPKTEMYFEGYSAGHCDATYGSQIDHAHVVAECEFLRDKKAQQTHEITSLKFENTLLKFDREMSLFTCTAGRRSPTLASSSMSPQIIPPAPSDHEAPLYAIPRSPPVAVPDDSIVHYENTFWKRDREAPALPVETLYANLTPPHVYRAATRALSAPPRDRMPTPPPEPSGAKSAPDVENNENASRVESMPKPRRQTKSVRQRIREIMKKKTPEIQRTGN